MDKLRQATEKLLLSIERFVLDLNFDDFQKVKTFSEQDIKDDFSEDDLWDFTTQLELVYLLESADRKKEVFASFLRLIEEKLSKEEESLTFWSKTKGVMTKFVKEKKTFKIPGSVFVSRTKHSIWLLNEMKKEIQKYIDLENKKTFSPDGITHRVKMFAHHFKVKAGEAEHKTGADWWREDGCKGRAKQVYSTTIEGENYKPPTQDEWDKIVDLLQDYPGAKIEAEKKRYAVT